MLFFQVTLILNVLTLCHAKLQKFREITHRPDLFVSPADMLVLGSAGIVVPVVQSDYDHSGIGGNG